MLQLLCRYVDSVFKITEEAVLRMESIGRDDKKLPAMVKDLYFILLNFLVSGLFIPWSNACTTLLLKSAAAKPQASALPPMEYLSVLGVLYKGVAGLKSRFQEVFVRPLSAMPNLIAVCKEARRGILMGLEVSCCQLVEAF